MHFFSALTLFYSLLINNINIRTFLLYLSNFNILQFEEFCS